MIRMHLSQISGDFNKCESLEEDVEAENKLTSLCTSPDDIAASGNEGLVSMMEELPLNAEESSRLSQITSPPNVNLVNHFEGSCKKDRRVLTLNESTLTETASMNGMKSDEATADLKGNQVEF